MVLKVLAWVSLASAILFAILAGVAIFVYRSEPLAGFVNEAPASMEQFQMSQAIGFWSAVVLLSLAIILSIALLVTAAFTSSDTDS